MDRTLSSALGNLFDRTVHAFTLFVFGEIDLTVFWQVPRQGRFGHHHLLGVNLSSASARDADAASSFVRTSSLTKRNSILSVASRMTLSVEDPIKVLVTSPSEIGHDFVESGLCILEIAISFKNCAIGQVEFTLELEEADEAFAQRPEAGAPIAKSDASPARFDWIGVTQLTGMLEEHEERVLTVQACFSQPGVYNLNRWRMTVTVLSPISNLLYHDHLGGLNADRTAFTETPSQPHYITVAHATHS
ncbi:hypothetical protein SYNPS1DRAFT_24764 [Syncephalis pseudoplumigaleata]|uniref:TPPC8 C-terminal Ig-like domain-containing protein n=1 Tax=Syncephalis pseudoplumigaleata TaxID=1712513 RepID=A0A4P9YTW6_9FUNG|nr:hypothetical protein SYNPS1DRAFT_24764 [Syncephalis pseudoplumigaleata]|eukprot:RKP23235.1 hypothetical protein SYNPS1DRAFT_24764 [Syncephalis pseudoplumigaleata]